MAAKMANQICHLDGWIKKNIVREGDYVIPTKLQAGDEIRVVAPSLSLSIIARENREIADRRLAKMGYKVTFGRHAEEMDEFGSSSIESRVEDLHEAFADPKVKGILAVIGGYNCNQLLRDLDYDLIKANPKIFCGYSDTTALGNAILAKTGLVTYSGSSYSSFGMLKGHEYQSEYFQKCLLSEEEFEVKAASTWSDDEWYRDQENRTFIENEGWLVIQEGEAKGTIIGGNLSTLNLLQGTEYMPSLEKSIVFLEDDDESSAELFDRDLQSLLHLPGFSGVKGLVIGRFQQRSNLTNEKLIRIIRTKHELAGLPVLANLNFGHTQPFFTFPIGGTARMVAEGGESRLFIERH